MSDFASAIRPSIVMTIGFTLYAGRDPLAAR